MRIDEDNFEILKKVSEITGNDYQLYWKDAENIDGYIDAYALFNMVNDLICEIDYLEEKIEDLEQPNEFDEHTAWQDQQLEENCL